MAPIPPPTSFRFVTEDTPADMLAGSMDLLITLPQGNQVKMSVERSTPMMDLLVQITTLYKVSTGGHTLQAIGEKDRILPYKPSTPIGTLDTWKINVIPRYQQQQSVANKTILSTISERSFLLQVRLPRNQLFVTRRNHKTTIQELLDVVCKEKCLDCNKYELRHPLNSEVILDHRLTIADYQLTEVTLVAKNTKRIQQFSSSDIISSKSNKSSSSTSSSSSISSEAATPITNMLRRDNVGKEVDSSVSGESLGGRSSSPIHSDETMMRPPAPQRQRKRQAPKPPAVPTTTTVNVSTTASKNDNTLAPPDDRTTLVYSHSRNSSDSSGYHEASVLSESPAPHIESPPNTLVNGKGKTKNSKTGLSKKNSNKKSRAPAPPPPPVVVVANPEPEPIIKTDAKNNNNNAIEMPETKNVVIPTVYPNPAPRSKMKKIDKAPSPPPRTIVKKSNVEERVVKKQKSGDTISITSKQSNNSSIGSSTGSLVMFGVGKSLLSMSNSQDLPSDNEGESLDLTMFEGGSNNIKYEKEERKIIGYRTRPKLDDVNWSTLDDDYIPTSTTPTTTTNKNFFMNSTESTDFNTTITQWYGPNLHIDDGNTGSNNSDSDCTINEDDNKEDEDDSESACEDDLDSAFQSVTDVLEEQIRLESAAVTTATVEEKQVTTEWLNAEEEKRKAEAERKRYEEERARLAEERELMEKQQKELVQLRVKLQQELEEKQKRLEEEQRKEIEKLRREQEQLERELKEQELEKQRLKEAMAAKKEKEIKKAVIEPVKEEIIIIENRFQSNFLDDNDDTKSTSSEDNIEETKIEIVSKEQESVQRRPPEIVELRKKSSSESPLRSAHSLYSLNQPDINIEYGNEVISEQNLRKTNSVADVRKSVGDDEDARLEQLQQQFLHWQEQLISNQSVLQGHVQLQSLQVLKEILPQMKRLNSNSSKESDDVLEERNVRASTLPRPFRSNSNSSTEEKPSSNTLVSSTYRYSPPTINLGTWSDRPKSDVAIKQDSDYRVGVGQFKAGPKATIKTSSTSNDSIIKISENKNIVQTHNNNNTVTEQIRALNKPKIILRENSTTTSTSTTTYFGVNTSNFNKKPIITNNEPAPVVKGFKFVPSNPIPPPPALAPKPITIIHQPIKKQNSIGNKDPADRDQLMNAIKNFGGRGNLKKTKSVQF